MDCIIRFSGWTIIGRTQIVPFRRPAYLWRYFQRLPWWRWHDLDGHLHGLWPLIPWPPPLCQVALAKFARKNRWPAPPILWALLVIHVFTPRIFPSLIFHFSPSTLFPLRAFSIVPFLEKVHSKITPMMNCMVVYRVHDLQRSMVNFTELFGQFECYFYLRSLSMALHASFFQVWESTSPSFRFRASPFCTSCRFSGLVYTFLKYIRG